MDTTENKNLIDEHGYRANIGIIVANDKNQLLWARRTHPADAWQFPQGGMHIGETRTEAMYRELHEELGLLPEHVEIIGESRDWIAYHLPRKYIRYHTKPLCIGQKQKWFLLRLRAADDAVCLNAVLPPELSEWKWVDYWYPLESIVEFKREVYEKVLKEFEHWL